MESSISNNDLDQAIEGIFKRIGLGIVLPVLIAFLVFASWNRGIALLYGVLSILLVTYFLGYVLPLLNLRGLNASMKTSKVVREGKPLTIEVSLDKKGYLNSHGLRLGIEASFLANGLEKEFWLGSTKKSECIQLRIGDHFRGRHHLGELSLSSAYPLGLYNRIKKFPQHNESVLVLPQTFPIQTLSTQGVSKNPNDQYGKTAIDGGHDIYMGHRDYRSGDPLKKIHWAASAKKNELVVKEFENLTYRQVTILLDLNEQASVGKGRQNTLEYAIKIAASITEYALNQGFLVNIYGHSDSFIQLENLSGVSGQEKMLFNLAEIKAAGKTSYQSLVKEAALLGANSHLVVMFDHGYEPFNHPFSESMVFGFERNSFEEESGELSGEVGRVKRKQSRVGSYTVVNKDTDLEGLFRI